MYDGYWQMLMEQERVANQPPGHEPENLVAWLKRNLKRVRQWLDCRG